MPVGVVVNPAAGGGRLGALWPELRAGLEARLGPLRVLETARPGDGRELALQHVRAGAALVIAAGGDGTANEVVDGLLCAGGDAALGLIAVGTGRDFSRTLGARDPAAAIAAIASGRTRRIDAGRVSYRADDGTPSLRHFINVASLGVSGPTVRAVNRAKAGRAVPGKAAFYYHTLAELLKYRAGQVRVRFDDGESIDVHTALVAAANGRYFGSGMMIAPDAAIDDGLLDVLVYRAEGKLRMVLDFNHIYRGTHVALPRVTLRRCRWCEVEPLGDGPGALIEVDGESPGRIPARIEVLPGALTLRG